MEFFQCFHWFPLIFAGFQSCFVICFMLSKISVDLERPCNDVHRFSSNVNDFKRSSNGVHRFETILIDRTKMFIEFQINSTTVYRIAFMFTKKRACNDIHWVWMILNDCSKICIDLEWCWTTVYWFPFFPPVSLLVWYITRW